MIKKILIVEDNKNISTLIKLYLENVGYECVLNQDGYDVLSDINSLNIDMLILDLMLPAKSGIEIAKQVRSKYYLPIIMITAKNEEEDKVLGLNSGADDYITKPFSPKEMVARVKALFRRTDHKFKTLTRGEITVDYEAKVVKHKSEVIELTRKEFTLLSLFIKNPGKVFSRDNLIDKVYPMDNNLVYDRAIDVSIARLRKKIGDIDQTMIQTVRGSGYKFNDNV